MFIAVRKFHLHKPIAIFLAVNMLLSVIAPTAAHALTGGPAAPEFSMYKPIGDNNMVNLFSGDLQYAIPLIDVGGHPLSLDYSGGIKMNEQASWVGLGWNLNAGNISREMRGIPDEFNGADKVKQEFNMKPNFTVGVNGGVGGELFGYDLNSIGLNFGVGIIYNNYNGLSISKNAGVEFTESNAAKTSNTASLGIGVSFDQQGMSVEPSLSFGRRKGTSQEYENKMGVSVGFPWNSRQGINTIQVSGSYKERLNKARQLSLSTDISLVNNTYIPPVELPFNQHSFQASFKFGIDFFGADGTGNVSGFFSLQKLRTNSIDVPAYGYFYAENATSTGMQDFNIENSRPFTHSQPNLSVPNFTYDQYVVMGHGIGGSFRPMRSDISFVNDRYVSSQSQGETIGFEIASGNLVHGGLSATLSSSNSHTGNWMANNEARANLIYRKDEINSLISPIFFQMTGEMGRDDEVDPGTTGNIFHNTGGLEPTDILIQKSGAYNVTAKNTWKRKYASTLAMNGPFHRQNRPPRNQPVSFRKGSELTPSNNNTKDHHIGEFTITKPDGFRYVFGEPLYNTKQREVSFNASGLPKNCDQGWVQYSPGKDNSINNDRGKDHYFNAQELPPFAYSWLLTEVLSPDYVDADNTLGPSKGDLGTWVRFGYQPKMAGYKWRIPYEKDRAAYNEVLKSNGTDDRGTYSYGEKEITYLQKIETKTHVAVFHTSSRNDAYGVIDENGGRNTTQTLQKLDSIHLFSLPDYMANGNAAVPIKSVRFEYNYELCPGIPSQSVTNAGKLTLKKVWFTYGRSHRGALSSYRFDYESSNPSYNPVAHNVWGDYKPQSGGCAYNEALASFEFPFVGADKTQEDIYASSWMLKTIYLPEGGIINIELEADDYAYVQDKPAMHMVKVLEASNSFPPSSFNNLLYDDLQNNLVLKLELPVAVNNTQEFKTKYLKDIAPSSGSNPIYFRFLVNLTAGSDYEYVEGFAFVEDAQLDNSDPEIAYIKLKPIGLGDGSLINVHPISKAAWNLGRKYDPKKMSGLIDPVGDVLNLPGESEAEQILQTLLTPTIINGVFEFFVGPNGVLRTKGYGKTFVPEKSWVRLYNPDGKRLGGGHRVKRITLNDNWQAMAGAAHSSYAYTQSYEYTMEDNLTSSGVASYIPLGSKENPLAQPVFFSEQHILAPDDEHYMMKPFGESFFPSPGVGYRRVTVKTEVPPDVTRGAGKIVHEFYSTFDFPTRVDYTPLNSIPQKTGLLGKLLKLSVKDRMTVSQGYAIETNDMNGKKKSERVYADGQAEFISGIDYNYETQTHSFNYSPFNVNLSVTRLKNEVPVILRNGSVQVKNVGIGYDMINWFTESETDSEVVGLQPNLATFLVGVFPGVLPTVWPTIVTQNTRFRAAVSAKVIHRQGILKEVVAYDLGARVATRNVAWDETGQVLLTQTENEFGDPIYNFTYPAHWAYTGMEPANKNILLRKQITSSANGQITTGVSNLTPGDELMDESTKLVYWVIRGSGSALHLVDKNGAAVSGPRTVKVIRSGHRNLQYTPVGSITTTFNPIDHNNDGIFNNLNFSYASSGNTGILDANATVFSENWQTKCYDLKYYLDCQLTPWGNYMLEWMTTGQQPVLTPQTEADSTCILKMRGQIKDASGNAVSIGTFMPNPATIQAVPMTVGGHYVISFEASTLPGGMPMGILTLTSPQGCPPLMICQMKQVPTDCSNFAGNVVNPYRKGIRGNWRAQKAYAYVTPRDQTDYTANTDQHINIREDGQYFAFSSFWQAPGGSAGYWTSPGSPPPAWQWSSEVTKWLPTSQEVENVDALGRYSAAQFGYNDAYAVAVAANSRYTQMGFDGFEDYPDNGFDECYPPHFGFEDYFTQRTNAVSHTGRYSMRVNPGGEVNMRRKLTTGPCQLTFNNAPYTLKSCDCAGRFEPDVYGNIDRRYVLSFWRRVDNPSNTPRFDLPEVKSNLQLVSGGTISILETQMGKVIEGWQKVDVTFEYPAAATGDFILAFENTGTVDAWIDDVRIHPFNSALKSFVYDPLTYRLWATLDERNFATYYQYDKEGNLIRIKKETERGIMTVKENFSSQKK